MLVFYRTSNGGYQKEKPPYVTNSNCLNNFCKNVKSPNVIIADNVTEEYYKELTDNPKLNNTKIIRTSLGSGAQSFNYQLNMIINDSNIKDDEFIYMIENDYIHKPNSLEILEDGINVGAHYISLYDHPDKYIDGNNGGNPYIKGGGEVTKVFKGNLTFWKLTNSTTMSFGTTKKILKEDYDILNKHTSGTYPTDFDMFIELRNKGRSLITPLPGHSTHGETRWLSPFTNWEKII